MPSKRTAPAAAGLLLVLLIPLAWLLWQAGNGHDALANISPTASSTPVPAAPTASLAPTALASLTATATAAASSRPPATPTPIPTTTPTLTPSPTLKPTATATATTTVTFTPPPAARICPELTPRPAYDRFYLPPTFWPTPDPAIIAPHFWLSRPLPGSGRFLTNLGYPYGSDGSGRYLLHNGVDVAEKLGTPVLAVADGTVVVAQDDLNEWYGWRCDWYGHLVVIELDDMWQEQPVYILYGHVLNMVVEAGQRVVRGQPVAEIGLGGAAIVPHLHLEVRLGSNDFGSTRNPILWFEPGESRGVIAGRLVDPDGRPWQGVTLHLLGGGEEPIAATTWSYLDDPLHLINPDEGWAENFVFADVAPGDYQVYTKLQDVEYRQPVQVTAGQITTIEIVTEPLKTPTPEAAASETPAP